MWFLRVKQFMIIILSAKLSEKTSKNQNLLSLDFCESSFWSMNAIECKDNLDYNIEYISRFYLLLYTINIYLKHKPCVIVVERALHFPGHGEDIEINTFYN